MTVVIVHCDGSPVAAIGVRDELQQGLDELPTHGLLDATDHDIAKVADLYRVIDDRRTAPVATLFPASAAPADAPESTPKEPAWTPR